MTIKNYVAHMDISKSYQLLENVDIALVTYSQHIIADVSGLEAQYLVFIGCAH